MRDAIKRFLCISSYEKGQDFMRQCAEMGVKPTLLTVDKLRSAPWPHEILEDIAFMRDSFTVDEMIKTVCWMCRGRHFDRVIALDEFDLGQGAGCRAGLTCLRSRDGLACLRSRDGLAKQQPGDRLAIG